VEAAHITWRPLGRLLVEQGLLTDEELEQALAEQQTTGKRLGETIVALGFVSGPELAAALASQYGIELTVEKGFGTGLRSEIQRRHETDRRKIVQLVPDPPAHLEAVGADPEEPEPDREAEVDDPKAGEAALLAQLEEQWAKLAAAEDALAERDCRLAELAEQHTREIAQLEELNERLRAQVQELRIAPAEGGDDDPAVPDSHLVFVQLDERYELIARDGPPPEPSTPFFLPDVDGGSFVVAGSRRSPLPGDCRPCVYVQRA